MSDTRLARAIADTAEIRPRSELHALIYQLADEVDELRAALAAQRQTAEDIAGYLDNLADHAPIPHAYAERIRGQTKRLRAPAGSATPTEEERR